ncbi:MAG: 5-deoxy-glucuronate isomerase [Pseudogulbenkiania sp.]|nr:5-deoxy-glucuronate isomerase [Pseudogulbenkiania sp.]
MSLHITRYREGFPDGVSWVTTLDEPEHNTGIAFGVIRLSPGEVFKERVPSETAWLLMNGEVEVRMNEEVSVLVRHSLFDETPAGLHVPAGQEVVFRSRTAVEMTVYRTANLKTFRPRFFGEVPDEHRCKDVLDGSCYRLIRTILDHSNTDPEAELVLGEAVTLPGRWAGYPPHCHPQPEIYHYRFDRPMGFGFSGLGDDVVQVRNFDTVKIMPGLEHPQVAAPGYAMYFCWVIRNLPEAPYRMPEFSPIHSWVMDKDATFWKPAGAQEKR